MFYDANCIVHSLFFLLLAILLWSLCSVEVLLHVFIRVIDKSNRLNQKPIIRFGRIRYNKFISKSETLWFNKCTLRELKRNMNQH